MIDLSNKLSSTPGIVFSSLLLLAGCDTGGNSSFSPDSGFPSSGILDENDSWQNTLSQAVSNSVPASAPGFALTAPHTLLESRMISPSQLVLTVTSNGTPVNMTFNPGGPSWSGQIEIPEGQASTVQITWSVFSPQQNANVILASTGRNISNVNSDQTVTLGQSDYTYPDDNNDGMSNLEEINIEFAGGEVAPDGTTGIARVFGNVRFQSDSTEFGGAEDSVSFSAANLDPENANSVEVDIDDLFFICTYSPPTDDYLCSIGTFLRDADGLVADLQLEVFRFPLEPVAGGGFRGFGTYKRCDITNISANLDSISVCINEIQTDPSGTTTVSVTP